ncbi:hypothetical protein KAU55_00260 [Candidatus Bathyarchaeota archaeon]|nr:hypothetical protein [Candidatus Bathyarchaeota archaeon]
MSTLKVLDKQKILNIAKVISWLDDKRWRSSENGDFIHYFRNDLTNCEKILTHWICYITDRQMRFEAVWEKGGFVFSELVFEFSRENKSANELLDTERPSFYEKCNDKKGKTKFRFKSRTRVENELVHFPSRYPATHCRNIKQTLEILEREYDKNIIELIISFIERFEDKEDLLIRIACALHLLTYKTNKNIDEIIKMLTDDEEFEEKLTSFKERATDGKKRLWCCLRDYKKEKGPFFGIFEEAVREVRDADKAERIVEIWESLLMEQLELPGDVWNNNPAFKESLFGNALNIKEISKWTMPEIVRELYEQVKDYLKENDVSFYPEQFDITFDFVPRMCASKELCKVCPFGKKGSDLICIPSKGKFCPVALITCGYAVKCIEKGCLIRAKTGKGICTTLEG